MTSKPILQEKSSTHIIFWICAAEVLTMQGVFTFSSMLPFFFAEWKLDSVDAGWISGIYYGFYMISVIILVSLTDWIDAKKIYITSVLITLFSCVGFALFVEGYWTAMLFRALGGIGLAGTYMPGLKALTDRLSGTSRTRATSFYTSSFGVGSAFSFLIGGYVLDWFPWETAFWIAGFCALLALLIVWKVFESMPNQVGPRSGLRSLDLRPVLRNSDSMAWIACYSTHNYELFAFRSWIIAYLAFALSGASEYLYIQPSTIVFFGVLLGMPSSVIGNELAMRFGRIRIVFTIML
ncbi:MAG: MFS transporter, partial [SAR324 cluster bacterium]|nr:MFS transporter [SAR324 cluster bacterium]